MRGQSAEAAILSRKNNKFLVKSGLHFKSIYAILCTNGRFSAKENVPIYCAFYEYRKDTFRIWQKTDMSALTR